MGAVFGETERAVEVKIIDTEEGSVKAFRLAGQPVQTRTAESARRWIAHCLRENGTFFLFCGAIAFALKHHYSRAGSDDLIWILSPTAWLVEHMSAMRFDFEPHHGFVNYARRLVIAPACAGVNFLIVAFCMAAVAGLRRFADRRVKLLWLIGSLAAAYALTLIVNALRILTAIASYEADLQLGWLTAERWHRLQGVVIYFFFLCLFYRIITAVFPLIERKKERANGTCKGDERSFWMVAGPAPFCWYIFMTVAVPLLNTAAGKDPARFFEHGSTVVLGCLAVAILFMLARRLAACVRKSP